MSKARAGAFVAAVVILLTILNTYLILRGQEQNRDRARENRALALANCRNIGALARIERAFIQRQARTGALRRGDRAFLVGLDRLARFNCSRGQLTLKGVRPGEKPLGLARAGVSERLPWNRVQRPH